MAKPVKARVRQESGPGADRLHGGSGLRLARMEAYLARTHGEFVANLKLACELALPEGGVLAGPANRCRPLD